MNYRHGFHAGNFADVFKHLVLTRILAHLLLKPTAFRIVDTHAGSGLYDLGGDEARRGGEWQEGIGRFRHFPVFEHALIKPYREALAALCPEERHYPGSPLFIRHILRAQDRAVFNELHPEAIMALRRTIGRDPCCRITALDAYTLWKAQVPPPERRGLVLVDPPFEKPDEFARMADGLTLMSRKWATGMAALWYPIKERAVVARFEQACCESAFEKLLVAELHIDAAEAAGPLAACGLMIANPPWMLAEELTTLLPELATALARGDTASWRVDWLKGP